MKREKYDRLCFDDMKTEFNCIEKQQLMMIYINRHGQTVYSVGGDDYTAGKDGVLNKLSRRSPVIS